jgi:hypothetical protein
MTVATAIYGIETGFSLIDLAEGNNFENLWCLGITNISDRWDTILLVGSLVDVLGDRVNCTLWNNIFYRVSPV